MNIHFLRNAPAANPDWDFYYCRIDKHPALISLDLNLAASEWRGKLPYLAYLSLKINEKTKEGFPKPLELGNLCKLEADILNLVENKYEAVFSGRVTTNGCRDLIFYVKHPETLKALFESTLRLYPQYEFEIGFKEDDEWDFYYSFLFPNERELNTIYNNRVIAHLAQHGDNPATKRLVTHSFSFKNIEERDNFLLRAIDAFFRVETISTATQADKYRHKVTISRFDSVTLDSINEITLLLLESANKFEAVYEGWQTEPVKSE